VVAWAQRRTRDEDGDSKKRRSDEEERREETTIESKVLRAMSEHARSDGESDPRRVDGGTRLATTTTNLDAS